MDLTPRVIFPFFFLLDSFFYFYRYSPPLKRAARVFVPDRNAIDVLFFFKRCLLTTRDLIDSFFRSLSDDDTPVRTEIGTQL